MQHKPFVLRSSCREWVVWTMGTVNRFAVGRGHARKITR
jgi:hypothetical protein